MKVSGEVTNGWSAYSRVASLYTHPHTQSNDPPFAHLFSYESKTQSHRSTDMRELLRNSFPLGYFNSEQKRCGNPADAMGLFKAGFTTIDS